MGYLRKTKILENVAKAGMNVIIRFKNLEC